MNYVGKIAFCFFVTIVSTAALAAKPQVIQLETKMIDGVVHWTPERIEVKRGERVEIRANHKLVGGFDFHGLYIPELDVTEQVDRNVEKVVTKTVPKQLAPGEYKIGCQFHPGHQPATLVVK